MEFKYCQWRFSDSDQMWPKKSDWCDWSYLSSGFRLALRYSVSDDTSWNWSWRANMQLTLHQLVTGPYIGIRQVGRLIISSFLHDDDGDFVHSRNCNFCGAMLRGYFCLGNDPCNAPRHRQIQNVMKPNLGPASPINIHSVLSFHRFIANILPRSFSYKNLPKLFISRFLRFHWIWTNRWIATTICLAATALSRVPRSTCGQIIKRLSEFGKGKQIRVRVRGANETEHPPHFSRRRLAAYWAILTN